MRAFSYIAFSLTLALAFCLCLPNDLSFTIMWMSSVFVGLPLLIADVIALVYLIRHRNDRGTKGVWGIRPPVSRRQSCLGRELKYWWLLWPAWWLLCLFNILSCNLLSSPWIVPLLSPENVVKCGHFPGIVVNSWSTKTGSSLRSWQYHLHIHPAIAVHIF